MRKVLLFLALFLGGLGVLWGIIRWTEGPAEPVEPAEEPAAEPADERPAEPARPEGSATRITTEEGQEIGVTLSGALRVVKYAETEAARRPLYELRAGDVEREGTDAEGRDLYALRELELEVYDAESGELALEMDSPVSRVALSLAGDGPLPSDEEALVLSDVRAVLRSGAPIVPFTLRRVPRLAVDALDGNFDTADFVQLEGAGVEASGTGMSYRADPGTFQLLRDARIEAQVDPERGLTATLTALGPGPLVIRRRPDVGPEVVELSATEGTEVVLEETRTPEGLEDPVTVVTLRMTATRISILGASVPAAGPGGADAFRVRELVARGGVVVERDGDHFRSEHGRIEFGPDGAVARAWLGGSPAGDVALDRWLDAERFAGLTARLEGEGPLTLSLAGETGFNMTGPCVLRSPEREASIAAAQWLRGSADEAAGTARLHTLGDVRARLAPEGLVEGLEYDELELACAELVIDARREGDELHVDATATGPTHVEARHPAGRDLVFDATGETVLELAGAALSLPSASGVHVVTRGERPWDLRASALRDLDLATLSGELEDVSVETAEGRGEARRAVARGPDDVDLLGAAGAPATFRFLAPPPDGDAAEDGATEDDAAEDGAAAERRVESGRVEAARLALRGERIEASGAAHVEIRAVDRTFEMDADELAVELDPRRPGVRTRDFRFESDTLRRAVVHGEFGRAELEGRRLAVEGTLLDAPEEPAETDAPSSTGSGGAERAPPRADTGVRLQRSTATVDGDVRFRFEGEAIIEGQGEHFRIDERGRGRVWTEPGRRVRSVGDLPGEKQPYELTADWIEFDPDGLLAAAPSVRLDGFRTPIAATPEGLDTPRLLRATADYLSVDRRGLLLSGDAAVRGVTPEGDAWRLSAGFVQLVVDLAEPTTRADPATPAPDDREPAPPRDGAPHRDGAAPRDGGVPRDGGAPREEGSGGAATAPGGRPAQDGGATADGEDEPAPALRPAELRAWGGFTARVGSQVQAAGERFEVRREGLLHLEGAPARLDAMGFRWEAGWIDYDARSLHLASDRGVLSPSDGDEEWRVRYESMQPFERLDSTILVLRKPVVLRDEYVVHANWALFWVDREEWSAYGARFLEPEPEVEETGPESLRAEAVETPEPAPKRTDVPNLFGELRTDQISKVLTEVYLEGDIELLRGDDRYARVESIYIDLVDGHGWINQAHVTIPIRVDSEDHKLHIKTEWLRHSRDGSLRADHALITASPFDEPTYVIETGDLELVPLGPEEGSGWKVSARKNSLRFSNGLRLPFPPLDELETDEKGRPRLAIILQDTARFGRAIGSTFEREISEPVGKVTADVFKVDIDLIDGRERFNASWLGDRGLLLGAGFEAEVEDDFWLELYLDGINDRGEDRGLVRVPEDERGRVRTWFRGRSRYLLSPTEWFDFAFSTQSDAAMQSEFFERDFLRYEERDNYVHWRKAAGSDYFQARVQGQVDDEKAVIEHLPSAGWYHGREPVGELFGRDLLYSMTADAGYLRRREGDPRYADPFGPVFADVRGEREVLRADNEHRLELPFPTGLAGVKATPFLSGRATAWDAGIDEDDAATRAAMIAGVELGTRLWKLWTDGGYHDLAPRVGVRTDLLHEASEEQPVRFDRTERPIEGEFIDLGLRSRWWAPGKRKLLDVDLTMTHAGQVADGEEDGWLPLGVLAHYYTTFGGWPVGFTHDGRYDTDDGETRYARTSMGFSPDPDLGFEVGYSRARDEDSDPLFEAASFSALWRATEKWELELGQTINMLGSGNLHSEAIVRRFGSDFVFEVELEDRAGEGVTLAFKFRPVIGYDRAKLRYVDLLRERTADR